MEFKKIDETKFQCLLHEEDMEDNNISLDDFFRNDTAKIHGLLDVVMQEAQKSIGVMMEGGVMSLQLAPQPNHSLLLTISCGSEDFGNMLKHAGEQVMKSISPDGSNIIKKGEGEDVYKAPFANMIPEGMKPGNPGSMSGNSMTSGMNAGGTASVDGTPVNTSDKQKPEKQDVSENLLKAAKTVFRLKDFTEVEEFCMHCPKTWGVSNSLYQDKTEGVMYLIMEKGRGSEKRYKELTNIIMEYGDFISSKEERIAYIKEHCEVYIKANAINIIKRICE